MYILVLCNECGKTIGDILEELEILRAGRADDVAKDDEEGTEWVRKHAPGSRQ